MAKRQSLSLGTVGCERGWRNLQRGSRNKARSVADEISISILLISRWLTETQRRLMAQLDPNKATTRDRPGFTWDLQATEMLLRGIVQEDSETDTSTRPSGGIDAKYLLQML